MDNESQDETTPTTPRSAEELRVGRRVEDYFATLAANPGGNLNQACGDVAIEDSYGSWTEDDSNGSGDGD